MSDESQDRGAWTRWTTAEYEEEAYKRAQSVIGRIIAGYHPMGVINLLSDLPETVWYPYRGQAERIAERIWQQLEQLIMDPKLTVLESYNFEVYVRNASYSLDNKQLATIMFRYNPKDVRDLSRDDFE